MARSCINTIGSRDLLLQYIVSEFFATAVANFVKKPQQIAGAFLVIQFSVHNLGAVRLTAASQIYLITRRYSVFTSSSKAPFAASISDTNRRFRTKKTMRKLTK